MPTEGQTATGPNGEKAVFRNGQWIFGPTAPRSIPLPVSATKQAAERRAEEDQVLERQRFGLTQQQNAQTQANQQSTQSNQRFDNIGKMRNDFRGQTEVKEYNVAVQQLDQALRTGEGPQGDLALTYAFAKAMDPGSVVREAEQGAQANTQAFWQAQWENLRKQFGYPDAGAFTPATRAALRSQIINSVASRRQLYDNTRNYYSQLASDNGFKPFEVVGNDVGSAYAKRFNEYGGDAPLAIGGASVAPKTISPGDMPPPGAPMLNTNAPGSYNQGGGDQRTFYTEKDKAFAAEAEQAFRNGAGRDKLNQIAAKYGAQPFGPDLDEAIKQRQAGSQAPIVFQPNATGREEVGLTGAIANNLNPTVGAYGAGAGNALTFGNLDKLAQLTGSSEGGTDVALRMARENPGYLAGTVAGSALGAGGTGVALRGVAAGATALGAPASVAELLANPITADAVYGGITGASESDNPVTGALLGTALGVGGGALGSKLGGAAGVRTVSDPLNRGERAVLNSLEDPAAAQAALEQGQSLGLPMMLADVSPGVRSLSGAAVRRNPEVAGTVRDALMRRGQGQIERFREGVERDLGPLANVPAQADALTTRAQTAAAPLYDQAYSTPIAATSELDRLLSTPFGRQAVARSETIAANEGRNTRELGFALDADGNPVLNPVRTDLVGDVMTARAGLENAQNAYRAGTATADDILAARDALRAAEGRLSNAPTAGAPATSSNYTTQALDYAKRGMDDILETQRNPVTGRLNLDEMGRSQNGVLRSLLGQMDEQNPAYGAARSAYAGPAGERTALFEGRDALTMNPDDVAILAGRQGTPERMAMMQLGARDRLVQGAEALSNSTNPYRVLNTPAMERRLSALYPDQGDSVARLLLQRDLEGQMAGSSNALVGNSATAERSLADQAFADESLLRPLIEAGVETTITGAPVMTGMRAFSRGIGDRLKLGAGRRAEEMAAQVAPNSLNPDTAATIANLISLQNRSAAYDAIAAARRQSGSRIGDNLVASALLGGLDYSQ